MDGIFSSIKISGSGMSVQRRKMNVVAENIANVETAATEEGGPYRRKNLKLTSTEQNLPFNTVLERSRTGLSRTHGAHLPMVASGMGNSRSMSLARAEEVSGGEDSFKLVYDPQHPEADGEGYVKMPDIEVITEMVDMIAANRSYEANAMAISASKEMLKNALEI